MTNTVEAYQVIPGDVLVEFGHQPAVDQVLWDGGCCWWLFACNGEIVARVPEGARVVVERRPGIHIDRPLHAVRRAIPDPILVARGIVHGITKTVHNGVPLGGARPPRREVDATADNTNQRNLQ